MMKLKEMHSKNDVTLCLFLSNEGFVWSFAMVKICPTAWFHRDVQNTLCQLVTFGHKNPPGIPLVDIWALVSKLASHLWNSRNLQSKDS